MGNILAEIVAHKRVEVAETVKRVPLAELEDRVRYAPPVRGFGYALSHAARSRRTAVIAEVKKASPSRGVIRKDFDPIAIARAYDRAGAAAISVLTDERYFQGKLQYLRRIRGEVEVPVLCKDFIVSRYQVFEARVAGADAILLIVGALEDDTELIEYARCARELHMDVLWEVHDRDELRRLLDLDLGARVEIVGVNNRNLRTFEVSLETTRELLPELPAGVISVSESGFFRREEIEEMRGWGVHAFLIGESLMREPDPGAALGELLWTDEGDGPKSVMDTCNVKICGIGRVEDARLAVDLGAWAIGFIFHRPSPRFVEPADARRIVESVGPGVLAVGVFVDRPVEEVNRIVREARLGGVQLHGSESPEACRAIEAGVVIKAFRVGEDFDPDSVLAYGDTRILLDTYRRDAPGGTGATFDWKVARAVGERAPVILAGGLTPANVEEAIRTARPIAVDVSSGVEESPRVKDPEALRRVFAAVNRAGG